jgi:hypothetical protein
MHAIFSSFLILEEQIVQRLIENFICFIYFFQIWLHYSALS